MDGPRAENSSTRPPSDRGGRVRQPGRRRRAPGINRLRADSGPHEEEAARGSWAVFPRPPLSVLRGRLTHQLSNTRRERAEAGKPHDHGRQGTGGCPGRPTRTPGTRVEWNAAAACTRSTRTADGQPREAAWKTMAWARAPPHPRRGAVGDARHGCRPRRAPTSGLPTKLLADVRRCLSLSPLRRRTDRGVSHRRGGNPGEAPVPAWTSGDRLTDQRGTRIAASRNTRVPVGVLAELALPAKTSGIQSATVAFGTSFMQRSEV
jgi:hypothetical protein